MSAYQVAELYNTVHKTNISKHTLQKYVQEGQAGEPLGQRGPSPGNLSDDTFNLLFQAFESYSMLNQINQQVHLNTHRRYLEVVQDVIWPLMPKVGPSLVNQLLKGTTTDFRGKISIPMEERWSRWTTYSKHQHVVQSVGDRPVGTGLCI